MNSSRRKILQSAIAASALILSGCSTESENCDNNTTGSCESPFEKIEAVEMDATSITIRFFDSIDSDSVSMENIVLRDKDGALNNFYTVALTDHDVMQKSVTLQLIDGHRLKGAWLYYLLLSKNIKDSEGEAIFDADEEIELHTEQIHPFEVEEAYNTSTFVSASTANDDTFVKRTKFVFISDAHMNDERSSSSENGSYGWFHPKHTALLLDFLTKIQTNQTIKELVFLGDIFDNWIIPMEFEPKSASEHFFDVAKAEANVDIVAKLNDIAADGNIKVTYVPGNHDMELDETTFNTIFQQVNYHNKSVEGTTLVGNGIYSPDGDKNIVSQHGHGFDFMCAPIPDDKPALVPPGYFVSRIHAAHSKAEHLKSSAQKRNILDPINEQAFITAWGEVLLNYGKEFKLTEKVDCTNNHRFYTVAHSKVGTQKPTLGDIETLYLLTSTEANWKKRQTSNGISHTTSSIKGQLGSIPNSKAPFFVKWVTKGLVTAVENEYFNLKKGQNAKIAVCGHSHAMDLKPFTKDYKKHWYSHKITGPVYAVYANTGKWDFEGGRSSYVVIDSAKLSGSEIYGISLCMHSTSDNDLKYYNDVKVHHTSVKV